MKYIVYFACLKDYFGLEGQHHDICPVLLLMGVLPVFQERAGDLEEMVNAEFGRLREFLREEEERIKEKLQKQKEETLNQLEEALTETTEQISQLESTAERLRLKLAEEENPEQLKVQRRW